MGKNNGKCDQEDLPKTIDDSIDIIETLPIA